MNGLARSSGAIKLSRKVTGGQLADLLMFDAGGSLNGMSMQLLLRHGVIVSKQALQQRFSKDTVTFMQHIFELLLSVELPVELIKGRKITIKDAATRFALPATMQGELPGLAGAGMKAGAAVQFEFGLKSGKAHVRLTAANVNDQSESHRDQPDIRPEELYLQGLGYAHIGYMNNVTERSAFFVNKLHPKTLIYTHHNGNYELLNLNTIKRTMDMTAYIGRQKLPVRLIIDPVDEAVKAARIAQGQ